MAAMTVTREQLFEQVWETPLRALAKHYGVSDVALAKVCRKLNVPLPGRGYWAKVSAGQSVPKRALPPTAKQQHATIDPPPQATPRPSEEVLPTPTTAAQIGTIDVPVDVERPHPLTSKTRRYFLDVQKRIARHAKRRPDAPYVYGDWPPRAEHGRYECSSEEGFPVIASFEAFPRALAFLDALAKALVKQRFRLEVVECIDPIYTNRKSMRLMAIKEDERFSFKLREGYTRRERSAKERAAAEKSKTYLSRQETQPNGNLTFELGGQERGINETFRDDRKSKLEDELGRIVAAFVDAVPRQKELRIERIQREREQRDAERRCYEERERIRQEEALVEKLLEEAERAQKFLVLREYLDRLERTALREHAISEEGRAWLDRARMLITKYDPAQARLNRPGSETDDDFD